MKITMVHGCNKNKKVMMKDLTSQNRLIINVLKNHNLNGFHNIYIYNNAWVILIIIIL